jgi:hypothetical protein
MAVGFLPYGLPKCKFERLADIKLTDLNWPLGESHTQGVVGDLTTKDHVIMCVSSRALLANRSGLSCRLSLALFEPPAIHGRYYHLLPYVAHKFHRIFTYNTWLLGRIPNARFQSHGGCFLDLPVAYEEKTQRISMIASKKRKTSGHRLRHRLAEWSEQAGIDLKLLGRGYSPLERKSDGLVPYRYSVVIENCREQGYFTEKLIDSLLCYCLPIYWGPPDVSHFFDPRGLILCSNETEMREAIERADIKEYESRLPFLLDNCKRAKEYLDPRVTMAKFLVDEDHLSSRYAA